MTAVAEVRVTDAAYVLTGETCRWTMVRRGQCSKRVPIDEMERKLEESLKTGKSVPLLLPFGSTPLLMEVDMGGDGTLSIEVDTPYADPGHVDGLLDVLGVLVYTAAMNVKRGMLDAYAGFDPLLLRRFRSEIPDVFTVEVNGAPVHVGVEAVERLAETLEGPRPTGTRPCQGCPFRSVCSPAVVRSGTPSRMVRDCAAGQAWKWCCLLLRAGADPLHALTAAMADGGNRANFHHVAPYARASGCDANTLIYHGGSFFCLHCGMEFQSIYTAVRHIPSPRIVADDVADTDVLLFSIEAMELWRGERTGGPVERFASRYEPAERTLLLAALCEEVRPMSVYTWCEFVTTVEVWMTLQRSSLYRDGMLRWGHAGPRATEALFEALREEADINGRWPL